MNKRKITAARNMYDQTSCDKAPFKFILRSILNEDAKMWNSSELLDAYKNKGGTESNSTRLVNRIKHYIKNKFTVSRDQAMQQ